MSTMLTITKCLSKMNPEKRTWRIVINRIDTRPDVWANLHIIRADNVKIVLEFQTDPTTTPTSTLMET